MGEETREGGKTEVTEKKPLSGKEQDYFIEEASINGSTNPDENSNKFEEKDFPVVGIGASAGGLAAFEAFFSAFPKDSDSDMAFVVVQHLDPTHKSILTELIGHYTTMPVFEVKDRMSLKPNCVYVIPPNQDMVIQDGFLLLQEPTVPRGHRLPINLFFTSLAQDKQERAIGIILSGTGSDGTKGIRAIKAEGGIVMVQAPESSEHDNMPQSAIATGLVDYILKPEEMPAQLITYASKAFVKIPQLIPEARNLMKKIFDLVNVQTGHDFSQYKFSTINRRVERRMAVQNIESLDEYVRFLEQKPSEVEALFFDFLIGVTNFFRNPKAFEVLEEQAIPLIFAGKQAGSTIRIWVPGCSTGEEAYSIGMLFYEQIEELKQSFKVQIFATDIDSRAIVQARSGVYPPSISADVPQERLERFFIKDSNGNYQISNSIRDMIVFSEQDIIKDPPFSKLDLISCRNVLIYMDKELQRKLIPLFHYALNPKGFLFLGPSETVGEFENLFNVFDRKAKIYQSKGNVRGEYVYIGAFVPSRVSPVTSSIPASKPPLGGKVQLRMLTERMLLENYAPAGALINEYGDIYYLHGRTGMYLEPAPGEANLNILKMAREGLQQSLAENLHNAAVYKKSTFYKGLRIKTNGDFITVNLAVRPVKAETDTPGALNLFLVTFEKSPEIEHAQVSKKEGTDLKGCTAESDAKIESRIAVLRQELRSKEEYIRASKEELETSYEELKSSNEEMQSVNEELQSTNEELETSKEELQSVNEELATVNAELQDKVTELSRTNNDMNNLLSGTGIGTIFVNHQLRILRFTPAVTQVINLIPTDVGRPVGHIVSNLIGYSRLIEDIKEVLDSLLPKDIEVQTHNGAWYLMRIRPYRTLENVIEGAVITFTEITELKRAKDMLKESETIRRMAVIVQDSRDAITLQDLKGNILAWNPMAEKMYGWREAEALQMNICSLITESKKEEELAALDKLIKAETPKPYRTERLAKEGSIVDVWMTVTPLVNEEGKVYAIATTERQINPERGTQVPQGRSK